MWIHTILNKINFQIEFVCGFLREKFLFASIVSLIGLGYFVEERFIDMSSENLREKFNEENLMDRKRKSSK